MMCFVIIRLLCVTKLLRLFSPDLSTLRTVTFPDYPQTKNSFTSSYFLISKHFRPELDPTITTLQELIDVVVMNQQNEDINVICYHTYTILT